MADNLKFGKNYRESFGGGVVASGRKNLSGGVVALDIHFTKDLSKLFDGAKLRSLVAAGRALDEVGNKVKTQLVRSVAKQAGVKYGTAKNVIGSERALGAGAGEYRIIARDVTLSLKEFAPRQTKKGVSAAPWAKRRLFPHTFIGPNGHVFVRGMAKGPNRDGSAGYRVKRLPIYKLFGPNIPKEMVKDEAEATFHRVSAELLGPALEKHLLRELARE